MGYHSDLMIDMMERPADFELAKQLGLNIHELDQLEYVFDEEDMFGEYNYRVDFDLENSNPDIIKKIKNVSDGFRLYLDPRDMGEEYYYDEEYEAIQENDNHLKKFNDEIHNLSMLASLKLKNPKTEEILNRQLYIGLISTMETFLSEVFINLTLNDEQYLKNFILGHPEFKETKFHLRDIFKEYERIKKTAKKIMLKTIYHNLWNVRSMYKYTFNIKFPNDEKMMEHVRLRHDLVHRNGKTKKGNPINIKDVDVALLSNEVSSFVREIALLLKLDK